jgi:lantibiotic biosynthesis protein
MVYTENIDGQLISSRHSLGEQITEIADELYHHKDESDSSDLLGGDAGITLFFAYLAIIDPDRKYESITHEYLEKLSNALSEEELPYNMSAGFAGIAFVFQHLRNIGLLDPSQDLNLSALDEAISIGAERDFREGRWDPLHGLTGLGIYFIERHQETGEKKYLEKIVDQLVALSSLEKGYRVWVTPGFRHYSKDNYNFGMAHGMPGLLSFLAQVYALGIRQAAIAAIIPSCLSFLLAHCHEKEKWYQFPGSIETAPTPEGRPNLLPSRHGWCYGDLGIANALIHCGKALDRDGWTRMGVDIALQTTLIPFEYSRCADAPFCHGALGLVHQYHRLYQATHDDRFKDAAGQWLDVTREYYYRPGAYPGGYACRRYNEAEGKHEFISSYGLLEGIAGIGLVYLSCQYNIKPGWDIIFQTNI